MSKKNKLLTRLLSIPADFTYEEAKTLLKGLGYLEDNKGKTSGSRVAFVHVGLNSVIMLHKPHPKKELSKFDVRDMVEALQATGLIKKDK